MLGRRKNTSASDSVDIIDRARRRADYSLIVRAGLDRESRSASDSAGQLPERREAVETKLPLDPPRERDALDWRLIYQVLDKVSKGLDEVLLAGGKQSFAPTRMSLFLNEALRQLDVSLTSRARSELLGRVLRELCGPGSTAAAMSAMGLRKPKMSPVEPEQPADETAAPSFSALVDEGCLSPAMARFLELAVLCRLNVLISGTSGTGRKMLLGVMARNIDVRERIAMVEAGGPIVLDQLRVQRLTAKVSAQGVDGRVRSTMPELLWRALAARPGHLLVGNFPDSLQSRRVDGLLQAPGKGQVGVMAVVEQGDTAAILQRLGMMIAPEGGAPGFDLVVRLERQPGDKTRVARISEIVAEPGGRARLVDLFKQVPAEAAGGRPRVGFSATGTRPRFLDRSDQSDYGPAIRKALEPTEQPWASSS